MAELTDGKAGAMIDFLENLGKKGRATHDTISALRVAVSKVLSVVEGDGWKAVDVTKLDVAGTMSVFKIKTAGTYNDASLYTYTTRLKRAISWYTSFLKNPGFTPPPPVKRSPRQAKRAREENMSTQLEPTARPTDTSTGQQVGPQLGEMPLVPYAFTLRRDTVVTLSLPPVIGSSDAARLKKFIDSLIFDEEDK